MQGPVSFMILRVKCASRFASSDRSSMGGVSTSGVSGLEPDAEERLDISESDRFNPTYPSPACFWLVRRSAFRSSRLFLPCTFASFASAFSSSSFNNDEASSSVVISSSDLSAKVNDVPNVVPGGASNSPGCASMSEEDGGSSCVRCSVSVVASRSEISL